MTQWYYTNGRSRHGPIDDEGVRLRATKGFIRSDTLLWHAGLPGWTKASELGIFPDDDVEPTLCAVPVDPEPPPIPKAGSGFAMGEFGRAPARPPHAFPARSEQPADDGETSETSLSPDEAVAAARASLRSPSARESAPGDAGRRNPSAAESPDRAPASTSQPQPACSPQSPQSIQVSVNSPVPGPDPLVTVGNWFATFLLMCIPLVNIIMVFVWAFGGGTPPSKANWAKAILLWFLVAVGLFVLFWGSLLGSVASSGR